MENNINNVVIKTEEGEEDNLKKALRGKEM